MKNIKISHEVPLCLLEESLELNDFQYALPHLLESDEVYKNHFLKCKELGIEIYLDNSLHELGYSLDDKTLLKWAHILNPSTLIVPDVWEDKTQTLVNAKHFLQYEIPENTTLMAVVQGKNYIEMYECYYLLKELGYKKIAFSYGASYYNVLINHPNEALGKALGRIRTISSLYKEGIIKKNDRIHLLGCSVPQEFSWYKDMPFIESIDTSNPIMAALEGLAYTYSGLSKKPTNNLNNSFGINRSEVNMNLIIHNTQMFRLINNL